MILKEICFITSLSLAVNRVTNIEHSRNESLPKLNNKASEILKASLTEHNEVNEEASRNDETDHNIRRPPPFDDTLKNSVKSTLNESNLEEPNEKNNYGEIDNSDVSLELSVFEKFRPNIADMIIILFNHKNAKKNMENENSQNDSYLNLDSLNRYSTEISTIDFIKFLIELEETLLKPSIMTNSFKSKINVEIMFKNLGKKFLKIFDYDYSVNGFPLVFYDTILPYIRKELLPIINSRKIDDRISWFLAYELRRSELFDELENLVNYDDLLKENLNLEIFLNNLNKIVKTYNVDTPFNRDIKLAYLMLFIEFTGIMQEEAYVKFPVKRSFEIFFNAVLIPSFPEVENSKSESSRRKLILKLQEEESGRKKESHFPAKVYQVYRSSVRQAADWFKGLMDFLFRVKEGEGKSEM